MCLRTAYTSERTHADARDQPATMIFNKSMHFGLRQLISIYDEQSLFNNNHRKKEYTHQMCKPNNWFSCWTSISVNDRIFFFKCFVISTLVVSETRWWWWLQTSTLTWIIFLVDCMRSTPTSHLHAFDTWKIVLTTHLLATQHQKPKTNLPNFARTPLHSNEIDYYIFVSLFCE